MAHVIEHTLSEEVLDKTMNLFWEKGYFNTSIDDITNATGFNRATLYKYFGDKDKLFTAMLQRFRNNITDVVTLPLQDRKNGINGIRTFFLQFKELYDAAGLKSRGCFLVSTASDIHSHNDEVECLVNEFLEDLGKYFCDLLTHDKVNKTLKHNIEINSVADFLVGNLFGLMSLCRSSAPKKIFDNHIRVVTDYLSTL